ncbi:hypothetical protein F383_00701 [Gossypium arboreum]|uniref:Uncharacterized protein n=1 Tax=Gossypium arboreum TaxID=29729 RepID=A0A0B0P5K4_GOSAR|nr:hypothetical protein F383_00701 [Gossypium arboreum]
MVQEGLQFQVSLKIPRPSLYC